MSVARPGVPLGMPCVHCIPKEARARPAARQGYPAESALLSGGRWLPQEQSGLQHNAFLGCGEKAVTSGLVYC